jgi:anti-sigma B factor antagonist
MKERSRLKVDTTPAEHALLVRVRGEIDLRTSPGLREELLKLAQPGAEALVVDLTDVPYMDSSGVGTLVYFKREAERAGRRVFLLGLQPRVRSLFEITHLDEFFRIVNSRDELPPP